MARICCFRTRLWPRFIRVCLTTKSATRRQTFVFHRLFIGFDRLSFAIFFWYRTCGNRTCFACFLYTSHKAPVESEVKSRISYRIPDFRSFRQNFIGNLWNKKSNKKGDARIAFQIVYSQLSSSSRLSLLFLLLLFSPSTTKR